MIFTDKLCTLDLEDDLVVARWVFEGKLEGLRFVVRNEEVKITRLLKVGKNRGNVNRYFDWEVDNLREAEA